MIANITKCTSYQQIIEYNEEKCNNNKASLLFNGIFTIENKTQDFTKAFDDHFSLHAKENLQNKVAHISLSLPKGEHISDDEFLKISKEYMYRMGYKNCPFLIYKHQDTQFDHLHIIVASIDYDGKKVKEFNDFSRSQEITRNLETKYKLKNTEYGSFHEKASLNEINARRYYLHNAIKKASHGYNTKDWLEKFLNDREKMLIFTKKGLTQNQIKAVIGEDKFNILYDFLYKKGLFNTLYKEEMKRLLDEILSKVLTMKDYINECKKHNIYVRVMTSKDKRTYFKYGLINENIYFKDTNLSSRLRYENVSQKLGYSINNDLKNKTQGEQFSYMNLYLKNILQQTGNYDKFNEKLASHGIETITRENKNGTYRISFKDMTSNNPIVMDGESFDISWKLIQQKFELQELYITTSFYPLTQPAELDIPLHAPEEFIPNINPRNTPEIHKDLSRKRKKKKKNRGLYN
jgi:hypothetical protein